MHSMLATKRQHRAPLNWLGACAPLPKASLPVQWRLVRAAFAPMRRAAAPMLMPVLGALVVVACGGTVWLLGWIAVAMATRRVCGGVAQRMAMCAAETPAADWSARLVACALLEAAVLGVAGALSAARGDVVLAGLMIGPLSMAAMHTADTAVFPRVAWGQIALLFAPLVVCLAGHGGLSNLALALVAIGIAGCAFSQSDDSCARAAVSVCGVRKDVEEPLAVAVALGADATSFQAVFGRDTLTGLPHRPRFSHLLAQESQRAVQGGAPLSLLMIHCDRFTADGSQGEIVEIARRLQTVLWRPGDALASFGGGRFGVLLPFTDSFGCATVAEKLRVALRGAPENAEDKQNGGDEDSLATPLSIGMASYAGQGPLMPAALMDRAEEALVSARKCGGDRACRYDAVGAAMRPVKVEKVDVD
jgi:diguanylate cyclase (GGDEF)-like protein